MKVSIIMGSALCALVASVTAMPSVNVRAASGANNVTSPTPTVDTVVDQPLRAGSDITNPERNNSSPTMSVTGVWASSVMTSFLFAQPSLCIFVV